MSNQIDRRHFFRLAGLSAAGLGAATVLGNTPILAQDATAVPAPTADPTAIANAATEMDNLHAEGVQAFLDYIGKDPLFWNRRLEPVMDGDVKVFDIECKEVEWETTAGMVYTAMSYNGIVPGPEIRVTEGDKVRFNFTNHLNESTAIHFHGLRVPNAVDGVPFVTQPVIKVGDTATFEFTVRNSGSHMYHSHHNAAEQVTKGLLGAFIVDPKDSSNEPVVAADYTMVLNDSALGFTINGKEFPNTQPILAKLGDKIRVRYMNEGLLIHPMHLHGIPQLVIAKDGFNLPAPYLCDTLTVSPGERYDVIIDCDELGLWAYHCHVLTHAESRHGMFGMVTVLGVVE